MNNEISGVIIGIVLTVLGIFKYNGKCFTRKEIRKFERNGVTEEKKEHYAKETGKGIIVLGISYALGYYVYQTLNETLGAIMICIGFITGVVIMAKAHSEDIRL